MDPWWSHKRSNALSASAWNSAYSPYVLGIIHSCFIFSFFSLPTYVCLTTSMACTAITVFKGSTNNYFQFISVREGFHGFIPLLESIKTNSIKILNFALQAFWDWTCSMSPDFLPLQWQIAVILFLCNLTFNKTITLVRKKMEKVMKIHSLKSESFGMHWQTKMETVI